MRKIRAQDLYGMFVGDRISVEVPEGEDVIREMTRVRSIAKRIMSRWSMRFSCKRVRRGSRVFIVKRIR